MNANCQYIIFSDEAYNAIMTEAFKMDPNETGGILLGHILNNSIWIVMEVLPPGWRSIFQYAYFEYDEQFVNYVAQNESKKYEQELSLLGLWHRHPGSMDTFSGTDDGTNRTFAGLHPKGAISGLVNLDPRFRLTMYHVSTPLTYTKVDVEVGDDLIPEEYFKWRYYDEETGLNPYPPEKKNEQRNTENISVAGLEKNDILKNNSVTSKTMRFLESKHVFFFLFLLGLILSLCVSYPYTKVKNTEDVKVMHKMIYCLSPTDSLIHAEKEKAAKFFDNNQAENLRNDLREDEKYQKDPQKIESEVALQKKQSVNAAKSDFINNWRNSYYKKLDLVKANREVKYIVLILWICTVFSLLLAIFLHYRDFFFALFKRKKDNKYWFQKSPKLYLEEETEIRNRFRGMEKTIENGTLSFFVPTDKKIDGQSENLSFQLVYSEDYAKTKEIKVYLITPDLSEFLGENMKDFPYIEIDRVGESYLDFSKVIPKDKISGMMIIRKLYEWLQLYNRWRKQEIKIRDIKLQE